MPLRLALIKTDSAQSDPKPRQNSPGDTQGPSLAVVQGGIKRRRGRTHCQLAGYTVAPQPLRLVHQYAGETPATALQAAGYTSEEVAGRRVVCLRRVRPRVGVTRADVT